MNIGLFFCRGGGQISKTVDVDALSQEFAAHADVQVYENACLTEAQRAMLQAVQEARLEGVVLAGCSPHYYEGSLHRITLDRLRSAGVNPNHIAFANLREQVALPHSQDPEGATHKARLLVQVALEKVRLAHKMEGAEVVPRRAVLVVGATVGGILAAHRLVLKGYRVYLLEERLREEAFNRLPVRELPLASLEDDPRMTFYFGHRLTDFHGWAGDFAAEITHSDGKRTLHVGAVVLAIREGDNPVLTEHLHELMRVELGVDGRLRALNRTTLRTETHEPGVFLVSEEDGDDTARLRVGSVRADSAVMALTVLLERGELFHDVAITEVDPDLCGACGTCVKTCAFHAASIDSTRHMAVVDVRRCKACGNCVTACPAAARDLITYPHPYLLRAMDILSGYPRRAGELKVLCLLCDSCGYPSADDAGRKGCAYPASVLPLNVCCGGRVDTQYLLYAFKCGFDGIFVGRCHDGHCRNIVGNTDMDRRLELFRATLRSRRIDPERVRIWGVSPEEGEQFAEQVNDFCAYLHSQQGGE